jgi:uncharacterized protein YggE
MQLLRSHHAFSTWVFVAWIGMVTTSAAQDTSRGLTVTGRGKVKAPPTTVEITGNISAEAELASDALTKFLTTRETAVAAIKKLGIENLQVESGSFAIGPPAAINDISAQLILSRNRQSAPEPPKVLMQESVRLRLGQIHKLDRSKLIETLAKIIDTAKEAGVAFGPVVQGRISITRDETPGFMTFSIDDTSEHRDKAETLAMEDVRKKADRLAKLSNSQLGEIRSIQESQTPSYVPSSLRSLSAEQSAKLDDMEISVVLNVSFAMTPQPSVK